MKNLRIVLIILCLSLLNSCYCQKISESLKKTLSVWKTDAMGNLGIRKSTLSNLDSVNFKGYKPEKLFDLIGIPDEIQYSEGTGVINYIYYWQYSNKNNNVSYNAIIFSFKNGKCYATTKEAT